MKLFVFAEGLNKGFLLTASVLLILHNIWRLISGQGVDGEQVLLSLFIIALLGWKKAPRFFGEVSGSRR
ncbi:hypothetical protein STRDD10_00668 [Streptococcus sp. DD10]|uniref:hypothetical protein n=1 Tax=Streptococcus sp. DD10 TaxID=1777878 RepID=UPI00079205C8|nr:hypothetical protein [Streptococcus sp. DD10]KXT74828.1 hypothetical protein STRDD10_00668 [Streptococcus sp. DD10]